MSLLLHARRHVLRATCSIRVENGNELDTEHATLRGVSLAVRGRDNSVVLARGSRMNGTRVEIQGRGNRVLVDENVAFKRGGHIWVRGEGCELRIGAGTTIEEAYLHVGEDGRRLSIGGDCMLAYGIELRTSDGHSVLRASTRVRINADRDVDVGDHVWIGARAMILKGVHVGAGSVVAAGAVVAKDVEENVVVGGNPATVLRRDVTWDRALR